MRPPRRRQYAPPLIAVVAVLGLLALGMFLGGHPEDLPGFIRSAFVGGQRSALVAEAIGTVSHDYYRPVGRSALERASVSGMVASLHDPYSTYLSPREYKGFEEPATFTGIGVTIKPDATGLRILHVFDHSPAARAGLKEGDVILKAAGETLKGVPIAKAVKLIKGPPGSEVVLEVSRAGTRKSFTVTRETIVTPIVASQMRTVSGKKIGWAYLAAFSEGARAELAEAVHKLLREGAKGLVLDLRGNGGGLVSEAQRVGSLFIKSGVIVTMRGRATPTIVLRALGGAISPSVPMVVLVDRSTASAAEIVTAALQDHKRAKVVGTHTFGKGVFQELEPLGNGGGLKITVGEYFTPNGRNLGGGGVKEGAGITPEVKVAHGVDTEHGLKVALRTVVEEMR